MQFYLASTFQRALAKLDPQHHGAVKQAALDFQLDPSHPGFKFHRVHGAKDRHMWSFRVERDIRAIVHHTRDTFTLCYVDHHDKAYAWAERHRFEEHPATGAMQVVEVVERQEVITQRVYEQETVTLPPLSHLEPAYLLRLGVPTEWIDWLLAASSDTILEGLERLPEAVALRIMELLTGGTAEPPPPLPAATPPMEHPDAARDFARFDADETLTLKQVLDAPWDEWLIFLHPDQRELVERSYSGPARVFGSAGTGKTVVALHRAAHLARNNPDARILLTTYTKALTADLERRIDTLMEGEPDARAQITVSNLHTFAVRYGGGFTNASSEVLDAAISDALSRHPITGFDAAYLRSEWDAVIAPYHVTTRQAYFDAPRKGRGRGLGKRQKAALWRVFDDVRAALEAAGQGSFAATCVRAAEHLDAHPEQRPFDHVIVDEAQDFTHAALRLIRALAPPGPDDLFLVGDAGQRLYGRTTSWLYAGVDVRGRSFPLATNYRTTEQIRSVAEALLPPRIESPEGEPEDRAAASVRRGPEPTVRLCASEDDETEALTRWLEETLEAGLKPTAIGIFARTWNLLGRAKRACERIGQRWIDLRHDDGSDGIRVGSMHSAKGLEFRAVAVIGCDADTLPLRAYISQPADKGDLVHRIEAERNLLYVAATRARERLFISSSGTPSKFLELFTETPEPAPEPPKTTEPRPATDPPPIVPPNRHKPPVEDAPAATRFRLSPSRIARYFRFNCQRFLRFSSASSTGQRAADVVPKAPEESPLSQAIFATGFAWEHRVLTEILADEDVRVAAGERVLHERHFTREESLELLREAPPGAWLYQLTLRPPKRFYDRFGIDSSLVTLSDNRPDLIQVLEGPAEGTRLFRVVDMKRGMKVRATYLVQLLYYALELHDLFATHDITDARADLELGAIWLGEQETPELRSLRDIEPHLYQLLRDELQDILTLPPREVAWHVNYRCEWCPFLQHCWEEMETRDDVSKLPGLTHRGKSFLNEHALDTVGDLHALLDQRPAEADALLSECASLSAQRHQIGPRVAALDADAVVPQGAMARGLTLTSPREVRIFLTLQRESLGMSSYALAYRIEDGDAVPEHIVVRHEEERVAVLLAEGPKALGSIRRQFVTELYGVLSRVDAYNRGQPWSEQLSVQFFAYSAAEESMLTELLFQALEERETVRAAQTLLLYFQGPDLVLSNEHPDNNIPLPITVLLNTLGRVLALPVPVSYTLPESLAALDVDLEPPYTRDDTFHFPLGATLRGERLYDAWYLSNPEALTELAHHIEHFLAAISALFQAMRERVQERHMWMPKFMLPLTARIRHPLLSKLAFFAQYESALACKGTREVRMTALRAIPYSDDIYELEALDEERFRVLDEHAYRLAPTPFANYLLVRRNASGRRAQIQYNDYHYREVFWGGGRRHPDVAIVGLAEVELDDLGFIESVRILSRRALEGPPPQAGERFLLYPRFSDMLTGRTLSFIHTLDTEPQSSFFLQLFDRPASLTAPTLLPADVARHIPPRDTLGLTQSQGEALEHLCRSRVLALWGPPGTGKSHSLATMILTMLEAHRQAGRSFRVLVTAFTHAAVENLLAKLVERSSELFSGALDVAKASRWNNKGTPVQGVRLIDKKAVPGWHAEASLGVLGSTVWGVDKHHGAVSFDLVVVDEASQVKVPEASIASSMVGDEGRVVFAGDHLQLPPIISGSYPEPEDGELVLSRSIFEAACALEDGFFLRQLQENFRMCDVLTSLSAELLYSERYRCATTAIAQRRMPHRSAPEHNTLLQTLLDPEAPMVIGLLDGIPAGKDNAPEAELVGELVFALRETLLTEHAGELYQDDADFFARGVFIVSPHHSQIHRIRKRLQHPQRREWTSQPFVDTVDKMQGQEAEAVIVSYGVSDPEYAAREADFIYSLQRLNVSITRGKTKTILLLPRALLQAAPNVLERENAARGLGYMRGLVDQVRSRGETSRFGLGEEGSLEVLSLSGTVTL